MTKYKIGQILTSNTAVEIEKALSGEKIIIPKGNKVIIGADNLAHHIWTGMIQSLGGASVEGYDCEGLAEFLYLWLRSHLPLSDMLEDYDISPDEFKRELDEAFYEIGLC